MELVSTMEINGEEREIADAHARGQIDGVNSNLSDYGLTNVVGNLVQGRWINGIYAARPYMVCTEKTKCNGGEQLNVKLNESFNFIWANYFDGSDNFISESGDVTHASNAQFIIPSNAKYYVVNFQKGDINTEITPQTVGHIGIYINNAIDEIKNDLSKQCKKDDITTNETLIGTFNGKNYYRKLFTGISGSGSSITVNVGEKIEIYNYYGRAYVYGQSGASNAKYPIPNMNYYIDSQNASETSFQLTIPTSSDTRKVDLVIEYTKVDE